MVIILSILSHVACQESMELRVGCLYHIIGKVLGRGLSLYRSPLEHSKVLKFLSSESKLSLAQM